MDKYKLHEIIPATDLHTQAAEMGPLHIQPALPQDVHRNLAAPPRVAPTARTPTDSAAVAHTLPAPAPRILRQQELGHHILSLAYYSRTLHPPPPPLPGTHSLHC